VGIGAQRANDEVAVQNAEFCRKRSWRPASEACGHFIVTITIYRPTERCSTRTPAHLGDQRESGQRGSSQHADQRRQTAGLLRRVDKIQHFNEKKQI